MSIYLDNSATTAQRREVTEAMISAAENTYGNPSSLHRMGIEAEKLVKASRRTIAASLGVSEEEIFFTSGGTESDNTAIVGACSALKRSGSHIITTAIEHPAVLESCKKLEEEGYRVTRLQPDEYGVVSAEKVKDALQDDTILVAVMHVNNETGAVQPVEEIGALLADREHVMFHCDTVQSFGKMPVPVRSAGIGSLAVSGHKFHGPKGMGILFVDHNRRIVPLMRGGGQEHGLRSGTENVPGIAGMAEAVRLAYDEMEQKLVYVDGLRNRLMNGILSEIPDVKINGPADSGVGAKGTLRCLPYILNVSFRGTRAEVLLHMLEQSGIYVSTGSACSARSKKPGSHVLRAMGLSDEEIEGAVRFSFSYMNTPEEMDIVLDKLKEAVARNRKMLKLAGKSSKRR